jgi:hypothetical protein
MHLRLAARAHDRVAAMCGCPPPSNRLEVRLGLIGESTARPLAGRRRLPRPRVSYLRMSLVRTSRQLIAGPSCLGGAPISGTEAEMRMVTMKSPLRVTCAAVGSAALVLSLAGPAAAAKPARDCPQGGPFVLMTRAELDVLATEIFGSAAPNEALFGAVDKNNDAKLCVQHLVHNTHDDSPYNFIDNVAH